MSNVERQTTGQTMRYYRRETKLEFKSGGDTNKANEGEQCSVKSSCHGGWLLGSWGQQWNRHQDNTLATVS